MAKVINIKWETDGYEIDLPNEDWLSDMSGWLHDGFEIVE